MFGRPSGLRIGRSRRNEKFRLDMHSISIGYRCLGVLCVRPSVCARPSRVAPYAGRKTWTDTKGHFAIALPAAAHLRSRKQPAARPRSQRGCSTWAGCRSAPRGCFGAGARVDRHAREHRTYARPDLAESLMAIRPKETEDIMELVDP